MWGIDGEWWILYLLLVILGIWVSVILYSLGNMGNDIIKILTNLDTQLFEIRKKLNPLEQKITLK